MLYSSVASIYLVCFLCNCGLLQCQSTARRSAVDRTQAGLQCLRRCNSLVEKLETKLGTKKTAKRHTCFKECQRRNKGVDLNTSISAKIPHLATLSRRRKRNTNEKNSPECPDEPTSKDIFPSSTAERHQYDFGKWYLNISWDPIQDTANFTGYALWFYCHDGVESSAWLRRQKNETFVVLNDSDSCWNYNMSLGYYVFALPCRNGSSFPVINLSWKSEDNLTSSSAAVLKTPPVPTSNNISIQVFKTSLAPTTNKKTITVVSVVITMSVLAAVFVSAFLLYRRKQRSRIPMGDAEYDAFIIFARNDQKWVDETLLPILEKECNYKCCVHYRDFVVGKTFVENMVDSVYTSRKVVAVMSKSFFTSKWCNFELQKAIYKHLDDSVVVIRIDDVSTAKFPKAIKKRSFIDYSNIIERPFFKTKLMKVLDKSELWSM